MNKKYISLLLLMIISLISLLGCSNDEASLLELKPVADSSKSQDLKIQNIKANWKTSEYDLLNEVRDVVMEVKEDSLSPQGLTIIFKNESNREIIFGEKYILEMKVDDIWFEVPLLIEDYGWDNIGYELPYSGSRELQVNWKWLYGDLEEGQYRIIKNIVILQEAGSFREDYMAAEFVIE